MTFATVVSLGRERDRVTSALIVWSAHGEAHYGLPLSFSRMWPVRDGMFVLEGIGKLWGVRFQQRDATIVWDAKFNREDGLLHVAYYRGQTQIVTKQGEILEIDTDGRIHRQRAGRMIYSAASSAEANVVLCAENGFRSVASEQWTPYQAGYHAAAAASKDYLVTFEYGPSLYFDPLNAGTFKPSSVDCSRDIPVIYSMCEVRCAAPYECIYVYDFYECGLPCIVNDDCANGSGACIPNNEGSSCSREHPMAGLASQRTLSSTASWRTIRGGYTRDGDNQSWKEAGRTLSVGRYRRGLREGPWVIAQGSGEGSLLGLFDRGEPIGAWQRLDAAGQLVELTGYSSRSQPRWVWRPGMHAPVVIEPRTLRYEDGRPLR